MEITSTEKGSALASRSDAVRNREAIRIAAERVFGEMGMSAPLQLVADQAGLGRGTMYRHYPNREALIGEILTRRIDQLGEVLDQFRDDPAEMVILLDWLIEEQVAFPGLFAMLRAARSHPDLNPLVVRIIAALEPPLQRAQAAGIFRRDMTVDDLVLVLAMFEGVIIDSAVDGRTAMAVERAKAMLFTGVLAKNGQQQGGPAAAV